MRASDVELIHADIMSAKAILYSQSGNAPYMLNMAAYHSGQAIEKTLKYIIKDEDYELYKSLSDTHNISVLVLKTALFRKDFLETHPLIAQNADELSKFNNLRYGKKQIDRNSAKAVYQAARDFYKEINQEYRQDYPDVKKNQLRAVYEVNRKDKIKIKVDGKEY